MTEDNRFTLLLIPFYINTYSGYVASMTETVICSDLHVLSVLIQVNVLLISYMFSMIDTINDRISQEKSKYH